MFNHFRTHFTPITKEAASYPFVDRSILGHDAENVDDQKTWQDELQ